MRRAARQLVPMSSSLNWGNPKLAEVYLKHFARNYAQAVAYREAY